MRTFEALGAGKKLITTNKEIKKYSFYESNNIFLERVYKENNLSHLGGTNIKLILNKLKF